MEPMHERYGKSDHEKFLDTLKPEGERGDRPFLMTGKPGKEAVVPWLMIAAVLGGLLTRSVIGAIVGAVLVYGGWFLVIRSFGGQFGARTWEPSKLARYCLLGGVGGFAAAFVIGMAGISVSLFLGTTLGVAAGLGRYQFGGKKRPVARG
jgi:hypothetical protein